VLEDQAHLVVGDGGRVQVNGGELLAHLVEDVGLLQPHQPGVKGEVFEDLPRARGELGYVVL
jgi:hypothetical protein